MTVLENIDKFGKVRKLCQNYLLHVAHISGTFFKQLLRYSCN